MIDVRVQAADFDPGRQIARLSDLKKRAVLGFTGFAEANDEVAAIFIDHYAPLARDELARLAKEAEARWPLAGIILIHRHGRLAPCDRLLFAGIAAPDPHAAQEALDFLVERMRSRIPFWRKDILSDGTEVWS